MVSLDLWTIVIFGTEYTEDDLVPGFKVALEATRGVPHYLQLVGADLYKLCNGFKSKLDLQYAIAMHYYKHAPGRAVGLNVWKSRHDGSLVLDLIDTELSQPVCFRRAKKGGQQWAYTDEHQKRSAEIREVLDYLYNQYLNELIVPSSTLE